MSMQKSKFHTQNKNCTKSLFGNHFVLLAINFNIIKYK